MSIYFRFYRTPPRQRLTESAPWGDQQHYS